MKKRVTHNVTLATLRAAVVVLSLFIAPCAVGASEGEKPVAGPDKAETVSFSRDVKPLLTARCAGCHRPGKAQGGLDLTTHQAIMKGGDSGNTAVPGDPDASELHFVVSGDAPSMPEEGEPLAAAQVELLAQWISQGAKNDTPRPLTTDEAPSYAAPPVITTLSFSPNGQMLAVNGYREVVLHKADGSGILHRLVGQVPRIEALTFSPDGRRLAICGGRPTQAGEMQLWDVASGRQIKRITVGHSVLLDLAFDPQGQSVAVTAVDTTARRIGLDTEQTIFTFKGHADEVTSVCFTQDGKQLATVSRDKTLKLLDASTGEFVANTGNKLSEVFSLARHPAKDLVACGTGNGTVALYELSKVIEQNDSRFGAEPVQQLGNLPGPVTSLAFAPEGDRLAVGYPGEVRIYDVDNGNVVSTLSPHDGPVFAIHFHPKGNIVATGGFDGQVRLFNPADGDLINRFPPVPLSPADGGP